MPETQENKTWAELATGLWESLTQRNAEISYEFENVAVEVPSGTGDGAEHATWKVNGLLKVRGRRVE
jgi:hypothetical protein